MLKMLKNSLRCGVVLLLIFGFFTPIQAGSILNFPRLSFDPATFTGVAIANPTSQAAVVTLTAYGADGTLLSGITNPVQITIPANQQFSEITAELFGAGPDPSTVAWFQATSDTDDLTGFFLFVNNTVTQFDGADLPEAGPDLFFNQVRVGSGESTELNLVNTSASAASLELTLINPGSSPIPKPLSLPALGAAQLDAAAFFGVNEVAPGAYVQVTSDGLLLGFELVRTAKDLLGLNAKRLTDQLTTLYFPQMAVLGPFTTQVGLVNYSSQAVVVTLTAYREDGTLFQPPDLQNNPVTRSLAAGESLLEDLETTFGFTGTDLLTGWLQVDSTSASVNGFTSYGIPDFGSIASVTSSVEGQTRAIFSHIATSGDFFTGVALLNSGQVGTNIRILAMTPTGEVLGSFNTVLGPLQRISKQIHELIPNAFGQDGGIIWVSSDFPVHLTSLFGNATVLANIPPQPAPVSYQPDSGIPPVVIDPNLAVIAPTNSQTFQFSGLGTSPVWKVNGEAGGNATVGTIDSGGLYTAPDTPPALRTVSVTGEVEDQAAGAAVDILEKLDLLTSSAIVQSVVYLGNLEKLYTAELKLLAAQGGGSSPAQARPAQESFDSEIFELIAPEVKASLANFGNEEISKMISFTAQADGLEYLLLAAKTTGRVIRLNPRDRSTRDVATGLDGPNALVIDPLTGDLLVAQKNQIITVPAADLEAGIVPAGSTPSSSGSRSLALGGGSEEDRVRFAQLFPADEASGIAADRCTGNVYISRRGAGEILEFVRETGRTRVLLSNLNDPTQMLALYRGGVGCPDSFQLIIIEQGADRTLLALPHRGTFRVWVPAQESTDLAFVPSASPFTNTTAILLAEAQNSSEPQQGSGGSAVNRVSVGRIYSSNPPNETPPQFRPVSITTGTPLPDGFISTGYSQQLAASGGTRPYTWSLEAGSALPEGLTLSGTGLISGTPAQSGEFQFTIRVTDDKSQSAERTFDLSISDTPPPEGSGEGDPGTPPPGSSGAALGGTGSGGSSPFSGLLGFLAGVLLYLSGIYLIYRSLGLLAGRFPLERPVPTRSSEWGKMPWSRGTLAGVLILLSVVGIVYLNSFPGAFHFDDFEFILGNPVVTSVHFPYSAIFEQYGGRPLTFLSFHWNYQLFGENPLSFHLVNVVLHALATVALFLLILQIFRRRNLAFLTALVFALHPLQTQAVNYIWARSVLLMACFGLLAMILARRHPLLALLSFQIAILCRAEAAVLLVLLLVLRWDRWKAYVSVVLVNVLGFAFSLSKYAPSEIGWNHPDVPGWWLQQGVVFWKYIWLAVWPGQLSVDHHYLWQPLGISLLALAGVGLLALAAFFFRKTQPVLAFGILWLLATFLPAALIPNADPVTESRTYLLFPGLALIALWGLGALPRSRAALWSKRILVPAALLLMLGGTRARNEIWKDDVALWEDTVSQSPEKARAHYNLGSALARASRTAAAEQAFRTAYRLDPGQDFSQVGIAYFAETRGEIQKSRKHYQVALELNPLNDFARERLRSLR